MKKPYWHHKPDLPDRDQDIIRNVYFGDAAVGRILYVENGPQKGNWKWSGRWGGLIDGKPVMNGGQCETREAALNELKETAISIANAHPSIIAWVFEHDPYSISYVDEYMAALRKG